MSTKKTTLRAKLADRDAPPPASSGAPEAAVSPPHADELARDAAEAASPDDVCKVCGEAAEYAAIGSGGLVALCRRCIAFTVAAPPCDARPAAELVTLQAQESDAEALSALCAAQARHPSDLAERAVKVLVERIAQRVLAS
jgi:hypothetical protein